MWVSWSDDGVTIVCDREQCKVLDMWWQVEVTPEEGYLQPQHLTDAMARHVYNDHSV